MRWVFNAWRDKSLHTQVMSRRLSPDYSETIHLHFKFLITRRNEER